MENYSITIDICADDPSRMLITTPFAFRDKDLIMALPGSLYDSKKRFTAPLSWAACITIRGIFGERLIIGPALAAWSYHEYQTRIEPALALRTAIDAPGDPDLYGYQRAGVQFLSFARQAALTDDMGLGKTVQTIRALMQLVRLGENPFPALVIAPSSMVLTWKSEFEQWYPGLTVVAVPGKTSAIERRKLIMTPAHVHIISYETAKSHSRLAGYGNIRLKRCIVCDKTLPKVNDKGKPANTQARCENCRQELNRHWETIIVDEAHRLKDPTSKQTRACWALRRGSKTFKIAPAKNVFALTGTPIADTPDDFWPTLNLIRPNEYPSRQEYVNRWCQLTYDHAFGALKIIGLTQDPVRREEFFRVIDPVMRRIPKAAVLPDLPPKVYSVRKVTMQAKQEQIYQRMKKDMIAHLDGGVTVAINPLEQLTRLVQFSSAYATLQGDQVRLADPSCKLDAMMEILDDIGNKPVVIFGLHSQLIDLAALRLDKAKIKYGKITGDVSPLDRDLVRRQFQDGQLPVLLCTIGSGGVGLTFTAADTVIFIQRSWSFIDNQQAEDRLHRIGAEKHQQINIIDVVAEGTVELHQRETVVLKGERLEELVRDQRTLKMILGAA